MHFQSRLARGAPVREDSPPHGFAATGFADAAQPTHSSGIDVGGRPHRRTGSRGRGSSHTGAGTAVGANRGASCPSWQPVIHHRKAARASAGSAWASSDSSMADPGLPHPQPGQSAARARARKTRAAPRYDDITPRRASPGARGEDPAAGASCRSRANAWRPAGDLAVHSLLWRVPLLERFLQGRTGPALSLVSSSDQICAIGVYVVHVAHPVHWTPGGRDSCGTHPGPGLPSNRLLRIPAPPRTRRMSTLDPRSCRTSLGSPARLPYRQS